MYAPSEIGPAQYFLVLLAAFFSAALVTPLMKHLATRRSIVDAPDFERKLQVQAVPYLGGVAIVGSSCLTLLVSAWVWDFSGAATVKLLGVIAPALMLAIVGLVDDVKGLTPRSRFLAQSTAGAFTAILLTGAGTSTSLSHFLPIDVAFTIIWVVGITNALNLVDNMDGAASGIAAISALSLGAIASLNGQFLVAGLSIALAGSCLGFLVWNRHPARIYMGDSGALFLGFVLAATSLRLELQTLPQWISIAVVCLVMSVPILDTSIVVASRLARGVSPFQGGLDHLAHRFRRLGLGVKGAVRALWMLTALSGLAALGVSRMSEQRGAALVILALLLYLLLFRLALRLPSTGTLS